MNHLSLHHSPREYISLPWSLFSSFHRGRLIPFFRFAVNPGIAFNRPIEKNRSLTIHCLSSRFSFNRGVESFHDFFVMPRALLPAHASFLLENHFMAIFSSALSPWTRSSNHHSVMLADSVSSSFDRDLCAELHYSQRPKGKALL